MCALTSDRSTQSTVVFKKPYKYTMIAFSHSFLSAYPYQRNCFRSEPSLRRRARWSLTGVVRPGVEPLPRVASRVSRRSSSVQPLWKCTRRGHDCPARARCHFASCHRMVRSMRKSAAENTQGENAARHGTVAVHL